MKNKDYNNTISEVRTRVIDAKIRANDVVNALYEAEATLHDSMLKEDDPLNLDLSQLLSEIKRRINKVYLGIEDFAEEIEEIEKKVQTLNDHIWEMRKKLETHPRRRIDCTISR